VQQGFNRGYSEGGRAAFVEAHAQGMLHALVLLRDRLPRDGDGGAWAELADLDRLATEQVSALLKCALVRSWQTLTHSLARSSVRLCWLWTRLPAPTPHPLFKEVAARYSTSRPS
jgi:hypothetical protein